MKLEYSIYEMLQPFCLTGTRIGTTDLICAIRLVVEQPSRIHAVQKEVYMVIAEQRHCHWRAVESSIRRSLDEAWRHNRSYMQLLANQPLHQCPSASGFIFLLRRPSPAQANDGKHLAGINDTHSHYI